MGLIALIVPFGSPSGVHPMCRANQLPSQVRMRLTCPCRLTSSNTFLSWSAAFLWNVILPPVDVTCASYGTTDLHQVLSSFGVPEVTEKGFDPGNGKHSRYKEPPLSAAVECLFNARYAPSKIVFDLMLPEADNSPTHCTEPPVVARVPVPIP